MGDSEEWISIVVAADRLGVSKMTARRRADEGALGEVRWTKPPRGGQRRVRASAVDAFGRRMSADPDTEVDTSGG